MKKMQGSARGVQSDAPGATQSTEWMVIQLQIIADVRAAMDVLAPDGAWFAVVSCQESANPDDGGFRLTSTYAHSALDSGGEVQVTADSLPLPDTTKAQFLALRGAIALMNDDGVWNGCVMTLLAGDGPTLSFAYAYEDKRGDPDNDRGYAVITPEQLLAASQQSGDSESEENEDDSEADDSEGEGGYYASEPEARSVPSGPKIKMWTCTWCHQSVEGVNHPASQGCPRNPGRMHAWHD